MITRSPLAEAAAPLRVERERTAPIFGVCLHTTGTGVYRHADPLGWAISYYTRPSNPHRMKGRSGSAFAHYVIGLDGRTVQIADEAVRSWHAGIEAPERAAYRSGAWRDDVQPGALAHWDGAFAEDRRSQRSPLDLFPGDDPNECYVSIELLPQKGSRRFSDRQYIELARLVVDVWRRHELPPAAPWGGVPLEGHWQQMRRQGRLVGHEDLEPLTRWDSGGGWDPGALRAAERFSWGRLFGELDEAWRTAGRAAAKGDNT